MAVLGLRFRARALSSCGKRGPLIAVRRPLTIAASLVAEHRLQTRRLSNCGSQAQPLRGTWDPPRPGLKPVSPHWQADSQPLRHQGSPYFLFFEFIYFLYGRFPLAICFTHGSVYMSIPISQFIPPPAPLPLSPLGVHTFSTSVSLFLP